MAANGSIGMWGHQTQAAYLYDDADEAFEKDAADSSGCSIEKVRDNLSAALDATETTGANLGKGIGNMIGGLEVPDGTVPMSNPDDWEHVEHENKESPSTHLRPVLERGLSAVDHGIARAQPFARSAEDKAQQIVKPVGEWLDSVDKGGAKSSAVNRTFNRAADLMEQSFEAVAAAAAVVEAVVVDRVVKPLSPRLAAAAAAGDRRVFGSEEEQTPY